MVSLNENFTPPFRLYKRGFNYFCRKTGLNQFQFELNTKTTNTLQNEIYSLSKEYDIAYFPWPFLIDNITTFCPKVATFHDFNYKYFFGAEIFSKRMLEHLEMNIPLWIKTSVPVVSSYFIKAEIKKFYPFTENVQVIHLAPLSGFTNVSREKANYIITKFGINYKYIIYPTNLSIHKNIGILSKVIYTLNNNNFDIKLILTGSDTEKIIGKANETGIERGASCFDILGLGYVSDEEMDSLIQCSEIVISTSKYEAGCGPRIDAWRRGVPVAMSDIPSFKEHINVLNVRAIFFDIFNADDITEKLEFMLNNYDDMLKEAKISQENILKYTWEITARKYYQIFSDTIKK